MVVRKGLLVGDSHAHPGYDNDRFWVAGRFARNHEVDFVHSVGDWTDFPSLNKHKSMAEARKGNYAADVCAGNSALQRFDDGLDGWNPTKTITLGNHDKYPDRYVAEEDPSLEGTMSWRDIRFRKHGWRTYDYEELVKVRGLLCSHHFPSSPSSGRAQGGKYAAHHNIMKQGNHCVSGHSHLFQHASLTYGDGRRIHGFVAGCMVHPKYKEGWCRSTVHTWDRGLLLIELDRGPKVVSFRWVTWDQVEREAA